MVGTLTETIPPVKRRSVKPPRSTGVIIGKSEFGPGDGFYRNAQPLRPWRAGEKAICLAECLGHGSEGHHFTVTLVRNSGGLEDERGYVHNPRTCKLDA